ncbi:MAG: squalene synthase HpnC [Polaromonas sp.]|nr:squalene synthase HpnC [Polaromonas sp.]
MPQASPTPGSMPASPPTISLGQGVAHYENFPVASVLCPPYLRPPIAAIYGFARTADDLADEGDTATAQRLADLAAFRADLAATVQGMAPSPRWAAVFAALAPAITRYHLPVPLLEDLLSAFEQDVVKNRYATQAELADYCRRSANPVGRLLLHLYGVQDGASLAQSDAICSALQLINFWQDLSVDISRGRIYLPQAAWATHHVTESDLLARQPTRPTIELIANQAALSRAQMVFGSKLVKKLPGRGGWELRLVVQGGLRILDKIEALGFNTLQHRPKLGKWDIVVMLWRTLWM